MTKIKSSFFTLLLVASLGFTSNVAQAGCEYKANGECEFKCDHTPNEECKGEATIDGTKTRVTCDGKETTCRGGSELPSIL